MTYGRELGRDVDLDLLADYIGGALDGTPEADTVERLVADDPAWAKAYAALRAAIEAVNVDLSALATYDEVMPAAVVSRLETALSSVPPREAEPDVGRTVIPFRSRRQRWARRFAPVAVAAGVLICVGLGAIVLRHESGGQDAGSGSTAAKDNAGRPAAGAPEVASGEAAPQATRGGTGPGSLNRADAPGAPEMTATGTDYTRDTVAQFAVATKSRGGTGRQTAAPRSLAENVPAELRRLTDPLALSNCLTAIKTARAQPASSVLAVDLARFEGSPAVIVLLTDASGGAQWVWVAGPDCGLTAGADTRFSTQVP